MDVRLSHHATLRMIEFGLSREDIQEIVANPDNESRGATAVEADKALGGRAWRVVYTVKQDYALVITVHPLAG